MLRKVVASGQFVCYNRITRCRQMFFGQYAHQVDQKGRMRLPAKFKTELGNRVHFIKGTDGCLFVFSDEEFNKFASSLQSVSLFNTKAQPAVRAMLASGFQIEEDNQGRFLLPQYLKNYAGIVKNIVFVGVGNRVELWDESRWQQYSEKSDSDFNDTLAVLENLGL